MNKILDSKAQACLQIIRKAELNLSNPDLRLGNDNNIDVVERDFIDFINELTPVALNSDTVRHYAWIGDRLLLCAIPWIYKEVLSGDQLDFLGKLGRNEYLKYVVDHFKFGNKTTNSFASDKNYGTLAEYVIGLYSYERTLEKAMVACLIYAKVILTTVYVLPKEASLEINTYSERIHPTEVEVSYWGPEPSIDLTASFMYYPLIESLSNLDESGNEKPFKMLNHWVKTTTELLSQVRSQYKPDLDPSISVNSFNLKTMIKTIRTLIKVKGVLEERLFLKKVNEMFKKPTKTDQRTSPVVVARCLLLPIVMILVVKLFSGCHVSSLSKFLFMTEGTLLQGANYLGSAHIKIMCQHSNPYFVKTWMKNLFD